MFLYINLLKPGQLVIILEKLNELEVESNKMSAGGVAVSGSRAKITSFKKYLSKNGIEYREQTLKPAPQSITISTPGK